MHSTGAPTIRTSFALQPATAHSSKGTTIPSHLGMMSWNRKSINLKSGIYDLFTNNVHPWLSHPIHYSTLT